MWATENKCPRCETKPVWQPIHEPQKIKKKEVYINKYRGYESVIIGENTKFVTPPGVKEGNGGVNPVYSTSIDAGTVTYLPNGNRDTITPLPYIFNSEEEFSQYLKLAVNESFNSLYLKVEQIYRKYVNVEEYYYPVLIGDTIWSYFQDRFPYTHYLIFTGDNGSGKNSALLVFRYLGYRVFYVLSANAANYYTALGSREEGQVCIAEDEADDIGENKEKRDVLKAGYTSGGSVPKVELEGGRNQENWLVYCHKWLAMEELKQDKNTKGILHRSLKMKFLAGDVQYNIKDALRFADDPEYKALYEELIHVRKLLFCFRLIHYNDPIPQISLNVKGRTAELVSPLIRLFRNSPIARDKIIRSLSTFVKERNESLLDSFENKLRESIQSLINGRIERALKPTEEDQELDRYTFTNESIRERLVKDTEAEEVTDKKGVYYSPQIGGFSQSKITSILKSKFKVKLTKNYIQGKQKRCVEFNQNYLNRLKESYEVPEKIEILDDKTPKTPKTPTGGIEKPATEQEPKKDEKLFNNSFQKCDNCDYNTKNYNNDQSKDHANPSESSVKVSYRSYLSCPSCGENLDRDPYYAKLHRCGTC
jgi:hypothetical protein